MSDRPNCYECRWRGTIPGDAHSSCWHPATKEAHDDSLGGLMAIFASVGRTAPQVAAKAAADLDITAEQHGIVSGWFNWPWNFDPVWLTTCTGFEKR